MCRQSNITISHQRLSYEPSKYLIKHEHIWCSCLVVCLHHLIIVSNAAVDVAAVNRSNFQCQWQTTCHTKHTLVRFHPCCHTPIICYQIIDVYSTVRFGMMFILIIIVVDVETALCNRRATPYLMQGTPTHNC